MCNALVSTCAGYLRQHFKYLMWTNWVTLQKLVDGWTLFYDALAMFWCWRSNLVACTQNGASGKCIVPATGSFSARLCASKTNECMSHSPSASASWISPSVRLHLHLCNTSTADAAGILAMSHLMPTEQNNNNSRSSTEPLHPPKLPAH